MELLHRPELTNPAIANINHTLLSLGKDIALCRSKDDIRKVIVNKLLPYFKRQDMMVCMNNGDNLTHRCYIDVVCEQTKNAEGFVSGSEMDFFINDGVFDVIENAEGPSVFDMDDLILRTNKPYYIDFWYALNVKEIVAFPLWLNKESIGGIFLFPREKNLFSPEDLEIAHAVSTYIGITISNIVYYQRLKQQLDETRKFKVQLEQENLYLQEQIKSSGKYGEVIGARGGLEKTFTQVANVASSDSTVLLLGETGTGKELIAATIHHASPRREKLMIKVNCAALPANLIESELFGHEKGSFTGALERRIGKFELAHNSTIFLDEIGEMSLELQAKLLRVLQEKEIERIGGRSSIKVNVRIIAATHRDLLAEVAAGRFRADLYYRLNVFPVILPPLRERKEDIPPLVSYFVNKFSQALGKTITDVPAKVVKELTEYNWPGNVRELEHVIERSILMATGNSISEVYLAKQNKIQSQTASEEFVPVSYSENERNYIIRVLKYCNGKVRGDGGAAELLNLPPTTLHSKMKKLGIRKTLG
ncbi:MAG: sigma 54-interacting transcriptional regulator [Chitinophagaceae bacterium]